MPPVRSHVALVRDRLLDLLDGPAEVMAVVGPAGAGVSTVLQQWSARHGARQVAPGQWSELASTRHTEAVLVMDTGDRLSAEEWQQLRRLLNATPELRIRLGLRSLQGLPPEIEVEVVDELAFTPQELADYVRQNGSRVDPGAVFLATAGHARAVRAIVTSGVTRPDRFAAVLGAAAAGPGLSAETAALAVPETLSPAIVAALDGPEGFLDRAERDGLGGWTSGGGHPVFALTPLVRAATTTRYPIPVAGRQEIRELAATRLLDEGAWYAALIESVHAGRLDLVDLALKRGGMPLLWDHGRAIAAVLRRLPVTRLRRWPVIAMAQALILNARREHAVRAAELMGIALLGVQTGPRHSPDRVLLRVIESVARRLTGFGDAGVKAARSAARALDELATGDLDELAGLLGDLRAHAAISLLYAGHLDEAREQFERAGSVPTRASIELMSIGGVAMIDALQGDIHAAGRWTALAEDRAWPADILDEYPGSMLRIAQAMVALEAGRFATAQERIGTIWPIIDTIEHWPILGYVRALIDVRRGAPEDGLESLRMLRHRRGGRLSAASASARMLDLAESTLALAAGDLTTARRLQAGAADRPWIWLGEARVALFEGDDDRALRLLGGVRATTPGDRLSRLSLEAILLRRLGRSDDAVELARRADALARSAGLVTPLALVPVSERDLFTAVPPDTRVGTDDPSSVPRLTEREHVLLQQLFQTSRLQDIAARLHVSANTLKTQRRSLYRKLGAGSREEALAQAVAHGLIEDTARPTRAMRGTESSTSDIATPKSSG